MAKTKTKAEVEDLDDDVELEELSDDDEVDAPSKPKADDVFGTKQLCELLSERAGKTVTTRQLRILLRKMARDGKGRVEREVKAGNRDRYIWAGPKDPEVKAIVKAFEAGELDEERKASLERLKNQKAKSGKVKGGKKAKASKAPEPDEDDDDLGEDDDED